MLANGVAAQPEVNGSNVATSLTNTAAPNDGTITYSFVATDPGTYLYESGTNPEMQVRMGLFGALIVYPSGPAGFAYDRADSRYTLAGEGSAHAEEFMVLLSEIDPYQHQAVEQGKTFNINNYHPRYWLINGRGFPDSIADNYASWLPSQPYGSLADVQPFSPSTHPYPGLARYLNVGTEDYPFHPHGNNGSVIAATAGRWKRVRGPRPLVREVRDQYRTRTDLGRAVQVVRRGELQPVEPGARDGARSREPGDRDVLQRQPISRNAGDAAAERAEPEPVRRVLHHFAQPRSVPDHVLGREHDRPHHVHADRTA